MRLPAEMILEIESRCRRYAFHPQECTREIVKLVNGWLEKFDPEEER